MYVSGISFILLKILSILKKPGFKIEIDNNMKGILELYASLFSYGRGAKRERLEKLKIKLPVNKENKPDWEFIEKYMRNLDIF